MRSLWIIISTLAIANLVGILGFVGWLAATDRLTGARVMQVRALLSKTAAQQHAEAQAAEEERQRQASQAAQEAKMRVPPEPSADAMQRVRDEDELTALRRARSLDEVKQMQAQLDARQAALDQQRTELEAARKQLAAQAGAGARKVQDGQFKQALAALEAQRPADARKVLQALWDQQQGDQVVAYLAAMGERARSRIMAEFIKSDEKLAARLLEQLRTHGVGTGGAGAPAQPRAAAATSPQG